MMDKSIRVVIQTQIKENYGAHDWDGTGVCPQGWKFKGGDTYIVQADASEIQSAAFWDTLHACVTECNDYFEEYIVGETIVDLVDFNESDYVEEWEQPINCGIINNPQIFEKPTLVCEQFIKQFEGPIVGVRRWEQNRDGRENYTVVETKKVA
jgi:hypothetical protein